jgi:hypothetical protein
MIGNFTLLLCRIGNVFDCLLLKAGWAMEAQWQCELVCGRALIAVLELVEVNMAAAGADSPLNMRNKAAILNHFMSLRVKAT